MADIVIVLERLELETITEPEILGTPLILLKYKSLSPPVSVMVEIVAGNIIFTNYKTAGCKKEQVIFFLLLCCHNLRALRYGLLAMQCCQN